jgi:hypothetical protein
MAPPRPLALNPDASRGRFVAISVLRAVVAGLLFGLIQRFVWNDDGALSAGILFGLLMGIVYTFIELRARRSHSQADAASRHEL